MGLSMGGMTLYHLALRNPKLFDSVILMAPALMHNLPSFVPFVTKFISSILPNSTRLLPPFADRSNKNPNVT
jgi:predicted alpha/beta superfamily hydrolase